MHRTFTAVVVIAFISPALSQQASLSGTVTLFDGSTPVEDLLVVLENNGTAAGECYTDAGGSYSMSVDAGTYSQLRVRNQMKRIGNIPFELEHTAKTDVTIASGANSEDIVLPRFFVVSGTVLTSTGDTVKGARLDCGKSGGVAPPRDWDSSSADDGSYSLINSEGSLRITVYPPEGCGVQQTFFDIEVVSDTVYNPVLPVVAIVSGTVTNSRGDTIRGIGVTFEKPGQSWQVDSMTDTGGRYGVPLTPGTFSIRIRNGSQIGGAARGAPARLEATVITGCIVAHDTTIDIVLPDYPMVRCSVVTDAGTSVEGVAVKSSTGPLPDIPTGDAAVTNGSGLCTLFVDASQKNNLWIEPPTASEYIAMRDSIRTSRDTTLQIVVNKGVVLSGTVFRSDSTTPLEGIGIAVEQGSEQLMTYADASGHYSIQLAAGSYRLRVRNVGSTSLEGVPQSLEHTAFEQINLTESQTVNIRLPYFPTISGKVYNAAGGTVAGVALRIVRWNGAEAPPYCETTTDAQGAYSIVIGAGVNKVKLTPPAGNLLGGIEFIESFDTSLVKDIHLPDQAKGITRVQPSVITRGEAGRVLINGINVALNLVGSASQVSLGEGVTVDSVHAVSAITLYVWVTISESAKSGTRDVRITAPGTECIGSSLLNITAPAEAKIALDNSGKTVDTVVIGDGTGTELTIPAGTPLTLPPNSDSVISYKAPIIAAASIGKPPQGEFTQVQRELSPAGLVFGDTVVLTCQYSQQDVEGINEATLKPYFFLESGNNGAGAAGDEIAVVERDTAANTVTLLLPHFSMFRLAAAGGTVAVGSLEFIGKATTAMTVQDATSNRQVIITLRISPQDAFTPARLEVVDLQGRVVRRLLDGTIGEGNHTVLFDGRGNKQREYARGAYFIVLKTATVRIGRKTVVVD